MFWARVRSQRLLQALRFDFPSKMNDLDAYLPSYVTFCRFRRFWKVANTFLLIWDSFSLILRPGRGSLKLNFQAVIKSAASAASPTAWELHGSAT